MMQRENLDEASKLSLQAIELDHVNIGYRLNRANLMMAMERPSHAIAVLQNAMKLTVNPQEIESLQNQLQSIQQFQAAQGSRARFYANGSGEEQASLSQVSSEPDETVAPAEPQNLEPEQHGERRRVRGTVRDVQCASPATMGLKVEEAKIPVALSTKNYYKVEYLALNFGPQGRHESLQRP